MQDRYLLTQQYNKTKNHRKKKRVIIFNSKTKGTFKSISPNIRSVIDGLSIVLRNLSRSMRHILDKFVNLNLFYL